MATNSRNNNNVNVMAEELGIHDNANSSQPSLSFYATGDGGYPSPEQKRKPALQRIKEKWQNIKGILKNGTSKAKCAFVAKCALIGACIVLAIGTIITSGAAIDARLKYEANYKTATTQISAVWEPEQAETLTDQLSYIESSDFATPDEKNFATTKLDEIQKAQKTQQEYNARIAEAESYKVKNVFKANKQMAGIAKEVGSITPLNLAEVNETYSVVTGREQGAQDQANATNQGTVQSIINGEGYYNMDKIQDTKNQIDRHFADANGNGTPDIVETVNGIKDTKLKNLANKALASMNGAKASADSTFATLQANWNTFTEYANLGDYATALSYYKTNIASSASGLVGNLSTVEAENANIATYVQNDQQQSIVTGEFSKQEIEDYAKEFENMGIIGTINSIDYTYDIQTGKINMNVDSENGSQIQFAVIQFKTDAGFDSIDVGSVMSALRGPNSVMNIYNISNTSQYGTLTVSENGKTSTISSQFSTGYSLSSSYENGVTRLNVKVVVQDAEGNIYNIGSTENSYQGRLSASEVQSLIQEITSNCVKSSGIQFLDQADVAEANIELG